MLEQINDLDCDEFNENDNLALNAIDTSSKRKEYVGYQGNILEFQVGILVNYKMSS